MCDGAEETLASVGEERAGGGTARQPIGRLRPEEDDEEEEDEEPDALSCKGGDHGIDSGAEHDAPKVRIAKRSLS